MNTRPKPSEIAEVAQLAYDPSLKGQQWNVGDVHVIGVRLGKYLVIAFRGTCRDGGDILRDMRAVPWWARKVGFGPSGFLKGARNLLSDTRFLSDVSADLGAGTVIVTGHSLGGAMALILAAWLVALGYSLAGCYAFEPARCGWWKMRRLWRAIPIVFVTKDGNDPVPSLPFFYLLPSVVTKIGRDQFDIFRCHRIAVVIADLRAKGL